MPESRGILTPMFGVSMPAVTTRFEMTKHDIRNGRKTGSPVSCMFVSSRFPSSPIQQPDCDSYQDATSSPPPSLPAIFPGS